jgi:lactoylglutathione lyase
MKNHIRSAYIILFVQDQARSRSFYENILRQKAVLDVPGMTAFELVQGTRLGLMPANDIKGILNVMPYASDSEQFPRCELYLYVDDVKSEYNHALGCGAKSISSLAARSWGDLACYFADPDGHIFAFAQPLKSDNQMD